MERETGPMPRLLVLDDDPLMLSSLCDVLQNSGYTVSAARSGQEALDIAGSNNFDLVLADVRMDGMDGLESVQRITALQPKIKSIVITGYASDDAPGRAMDAFTCDYLRKPFGAEQLLLSVSRALSAGKESSGYRALVEKARSVAQKVGASVTGMDASRDHAFQNYYVGVRAGHLNAAAARATWDELEAIEWERLNAEKDLTLLTKALELKKRYDDFCVVCKTPAALPAPDGERKGVGQREFQPLFRNVRNAEISCEQLKLAVYLRSATGEELRAAPELEKIKSQIWNVLTLPE